MATPRTAQCWAASAPKEKLHKTAVELAPLGHNGVEIKVTHCAICGSDVHLLEADGGYADFGAWPKKQVCGHEIVGKVTGVGAGVGHLAVGQRVGVGWQNGACHDCEWCLNGDEQLCPAVSCTCCEGQVGGFADYVRLADARFAYALPDSLDSAKTAPLLCGGQTVWTPLRQQAKRDDRVGILGLGGLGSMALTFAGKMGFRRVVAVSSSGAKKDKALALGATDYCDHSSAEDLAKFAASLDFLLVTLATTRELPDVGKFFALLRPRGTACFVGMCPPITADVFTLGFTMNNITTSNTGGRKDMRDMLDFCAHHGIGATIETRPMDDVNAALEDLKTSHGIVRYVLCNDVDDEPIATAG